MPLRDTDAMNRSLDNDYGATHGSNAPASHDLALFFGDPSIPEADGGGVELNATDCPGYVRATLVNDAGWPAASSGAKSRTVAFPDSTGEWVTGATHWALLGSDGFWWDTGELAEPLDVTGAGSFDSVVVTIQYDDSIEVA